MAGSAAAASHPFLIVSNLDSYIQSQELIVAVPTNDPAVDETTIYVGRGASLVLRPGGAFGDAQADLMSSQAYGSTIFQLVGDVVSADPAKYQNNDCAPGPHAAVWIAELTPLFLNATIDIPIYVDAAKPAEEPYASYVLKTCMPSPYVPYPDGAIFGGRLLDLELYLANFRQAGDSRWTTIVTPFRADGGVDSPGAAEGQAAVSQGSISTLVVRRTVRRRGPRARYFAHIHGRVTTVAGAGIRAKVEVYELFSKSSGPHVASLKSRANGSFSVTVRQKRTASYGIVATRLGGEVTPAVCSPVLDLGFGPLSCASLTTSDFQSARVTKKVRIPRGGEGIPARRAAAILRSRLLPRRGGTLRP